MPKRRPPPPADDGLADALAAMAGGESDAGPSDEEVAEFDDPAASPEEVAAPDASPVVPERPASPTRPAAPANAPRRAVRPVVASVGPADGPDDVPAPPPTPQVRRSAARRGEKPARRPAASKTARRRAANPNLDFQRTIIPVCLTLGVLLPLFGLYWLLNGEDSPVRLLPGWLPAGLTAVGAVLGLLGVATMLRVGRAMRE